MNTVLDVLLLRRARLEYVSPPICISDFSSSGTPVIVLEPIEPLSSPSGLVWGKSGRGRFLQWAVYPGVICFSIYHRVDNNPNSPFNLISECVDPNVIAVCEIGTYQLSANTPAGETALSDPVAVPGGSYVFLPLPQYPGQLSCNLYHNGVKIWAGFNGGAFQVCDDMGVDDCFAISAITPDGATDLSDPLCISVDDCPAQVCDSGEIWNFVACDCLPCDAQVCPWGEHWDAALCECVLDPVPPCAGFIDMLDVKRMYALSYSGQAIAGWNYDDTLYRYVNRVLTPTGVGSAPTVSYVTPAGIIAGDAWTPDSVNYYGFSLDSLPVTLVGPGDPTAASFTTRGQDLNGNFVFYDEKSLLPDYGLYVYSKLGLQLWSNVGAWAFAPRGCMSPAGSIIYSDDEIAVGGGHYEVTLKLRTLSGTTHSLLQINETLSHVANTSDHWAIACNTWADLVPDLYYWDGATFSLAVAGTGGITAWAINDHDIVAAADSTDGPFVWSPTLGFLSLGMPVGATSVSWMAITNSSIVIMQTDNGCWYYDGGSWYDWLATIPTGATLWSSLIESYGANVDGFCYGLGVYDGGVQYFAATGCPADVILYP
jgi:hypothetical protein